MTTERKTIVIAGGTGFLGHILMKHLPAYRFIVLTRTPRTNTANVQYIQWDAMNTGPWVQALEGCEVLINLTGKSVNCRYNSRNRQEIIGSRVYSTRVLGVAVNQLQQPPKLWINAASATIYRHAEDRPMDEYNGETGTGFSVDVCTQWEETFNRCQTPGTRKIVLRTGIVIGKDGDTLKMLQRVCRLGLGGRMGNGEQYMNWLQDIDFCRMVEWCINNEHASGIYNAVGPNPLKNKVFMQKLRKAVGAWFGLPNPAWLLEIGMWLIRSETELILKSRWVLPSRFEKEGFKFLYTEPDLNP